MKRAFQIFQWTFIAITCFLPLCVLLALVFDYIFELKSYPAFAIISVVLGITTLVLFILQKKRDKDYFPTPLFSIVTLVSIVNDIIYMVCDFVSWVWIGPVMFVCTVICVVFTILSPACRAKTFSLVIMIFAAIPILLWGIASVLLSLAFYEIETSDALVEIEIVSTIDNDYNSYYAEVISIDEGALGGDTEVNVYKNSVFDAILFKISSRPKTVYRGGFGEHEDMEIYWKDNRCLVINGKEYEIE